MIKYQLGKITEKSGARQYKLIELNDKEQFNFFEQNHIQGGIASKLAFGLVDKNMNIVAAMSFGSPRYNKQYEWEILRFATLTDNLVSGAASKIFSHFKSNYSGSVISYANKRFSKGDVYKKMGFSYHGHTKPNYFYLIDGKCYSRVSFQKHKLKHKLKIYDESLTEKQNMANNNIYPIYDSGNQIWIYN